MGSRKSQGIARDFWEEEKQCCGACDCLWATAATRMLFRRAQREKNKGEAAAGKPCGGEHLVVSPITEKSFVSFKTFFVNSPYSLAKAKTALFAFALYALRKA